jgi:hypothetical protein
MQHGGRSPVRDAAKTPDSATTTVVKADQENSNPNTLTAINTIILKPKSSQEKS